MKKLLLIILLFGLTGCSQPIVNRDVVEETVFGGGDKAIVKTVTDKKLKISKWNDEVSFDIEYDGKHDVHMYDTENGVEYDVLLPEKPKKNVFVYSYNKKDVVLYYQPALTQEEIDDGAFRPDNVVGSYAVYHATKKDHIIGQTNYMTGKVAHIYRPEAIDANGDRVWCDMVADGGKIRVTVPQDFLDNAVYPVVLDPLIGSDSIGGSWGSWSTNRYLGKALTTTEAGTLTGISAYVWGFNAADAFKGVLVLPTNSYSGSIVTNGVGAALVKGTGDAAWVESTYSTSPSLADATEYWFSIVTYGPSFYIAYDSGGNTEYESDNNYSSPTDPTTTSNLTHTVSIYGTYTTGGGGTDTCTYSGTGNWNVLYSDNCTCTTTTYVLGDFNLNYDGAGSFNLRALLQADNINVGAGATISAENSSAQIDIY